MTVFQYIAQDEEGKEVRGTIDATDEQSAKDALMQINMQPVSVSAQQAATPPPPPPQAPKPSVTPATTAPPSTTPPPPPPPPAPKEIVEEKAPPPPAQEPAQKSSPANVPPPQTSAPTTPSKPKEVQKTISNTVSTAKAVTQNNDTKKTEQPKKSGISFAPRNEDTSPTSTATKRPPRYASLVSTLRLYAGWLFAWYSAAVGLGYYAYVRELSFDIPIVRSLFLSSLVFSFASATFLFLMFTSLHKTLRGGIVLATVFLLIGTAGFWGLRLGI